MRLKLILTLGVIALSIGFTGCTASITTGNNANAKPANTANTSSTANTASNTTSAANTAAAPKTSGDTINLDEGGITMTVPSGFKHEKEGNDTVVTTPDGGVEILLTVPADGDYDKARVDAAKDIDKYITGQHSIFIAYHGWT